MKARYISKKLKIRIYKTIIKPIVVYGSESWTLTERNCHMLAAWERKILRRIFGPKLNNGMWCIRTNEELNELYKDVNIVVDIKVRRLEWLGHVMRMTNDRVPKIVLNAKLDGKRKVGRPKLRWYDDVQNDIRKMGLKGWWEKAKNRSEWWHIMKEAKVKL